MSGEQEPVARALDLYVRIALERDRLRAKVAALNETVRVQARQLDELRLELDHLAAGGAPLAAPGTFWARLGAAVALDDPQRDGGSAS